MAIPTFTTGYALSVGDAQFPQLWRGLVGAWCPSLGKQGSTLFDVSPYSQNASLNNMDANTDYVPGKFGTALNFDGTDDYLNMGNLTPIADATQDLTFTFWQRSSNSQSNNAIFTYDIDNALSPSADIYCMFKTNFTIGGFGDASEWNTGYASSNFTDGTWNHIAIILRGGNKYVYHNGQLVASTSTAHNHANYGTTHNLHVADNLNVGHYTGGIGDFLVYNRALSEDEITLLYSGRSHLALRVIPSPYFLSPDDQFLPNTLDISSEVLAPIILVDNIVITPDTLDISSSVLAPNIPEDAPFGSKIISYNPLLIVTNGNPAKIVEINITDPLIPITTVTTLVGATNAKDIARNSVTGFLFIACANGIVVKVDETNLSSQTIIDLSDTDDLQTIEALENFGIVYTSTDSTTGELYQIDERTTVLGDFRLDVLSSQTVFVDLQFDLISASNMDSNIQVLSEVTTTMSCDFKCLTNVLDDIIPIKRTDFQIFINSVELDNVDLILDSITITHNVGEDSIATFSLTRLHDNLDIDKAGNTRQITNQNTVEIKIQGITEFTGNISKLDCQYNLSNDNVIVTATGDEKTCRIDNIGLSLPSLDKRLGLYDILIENPTIFNPVIDPNDENPSKYKGITVNLGEKVIQSYSRFTFFDSLGSIAIGIQDGSYVPKQNWTYFWSPTVTKFGEVELGDTSSILFNYIGTSLSPISEDLWVLDNAKHRRQRQRDNIISQLGDYTVGVAPFKEIRTRNGILIPKFHWTDETNGLYSIKDAGYNFENYAKTVADLEYQKILNINGTILPETSADFTLTIDGYFYYRLSMLTRLNIDNTTQVGIYKNNNGFPVSIKGINISSSSMQVTLTADNQKSTKELELIDGLFPDEDDEEYNEVEDRILLALKSDMRTRLEVE